MTVRLNGVTFTDVAPDTGPKERGPGLRISCHPGVTASGPGWRSRQTAPAKMGPTSCLFNDFLAFHPTTEETEDYQNLLNITIRTTKTFSGQNY